MIELRSILYYLGLALWTSVWGSITLLTWPLPKPIGFWFCAFWGRVATAWLSFSCGLRYQIHGQQHIPKSPCVIIANHQSTWETIAFLSMFPRFAYVLKRELFRIPIFGWALKCSWPIGINRKAGRDALHQVMEDGVQRIQSGVYVLVFPEGTRQAHGQLGKFASTGAGLAVKAKVPILPVAHNAGRYWRPRDWRKYPGKVEIHIGPSISSHGKTATALNQAARDWIAAELAQIP